MRSAAAVRAAWLGRLERVLDPLTPCAGGALRSDGDLNGQPISHARPRDAAVLAALMPGEEGWDVLFTLRAAHLTRHAGQISFPGGRHDAGDASLADTALREAEEEVGLSSERVQLLGGFDEYHTVTGVRVRPFVGVVDGPFEPQPCAREVEDVFTAPLEFFMNQSNHRVESRLFRGAERRYYAMPWQDRYIWGATAGMLRALSDRVLQNEEG